MSQKINAIGKRYVRPWGDYQTIAISKNYQVKIITVKPGGKLSLQKHAQRAEHWVITQGEPIVTVNAQVQKLACNAHVFIPKGALHRLENDTADTVQFIEVQVGDYLGEDDIVRLDDIYGRK